MRIKSSYNRTVAETASYMGEILKVSSTNEWEIVRVIANIRDQKTRDQVIAVLQLCPDSVWDSVAEAAPRPSSAVGVVLLEILGFVPANRDSGIITRGFSLSGLSSLVAGNGSPAAMKEVVRRFKKEAPAVIKVAAKNDCLMQSYFRRVDGLK